MNKNCIVYFFSLVLIFNLASCKENIGNLEKINVSTIKGDTLNLFDFGENQIIVFVQSYSCHNCNISLNQAIKTVKEKYGNPFKVNVILWTHNEIDSKYQLRNYISNFLIAENYFFDIHGFENTDYHLVHKEGLYNKYSILNTPSILFLHKGNLKYYKYKELFNVGLNEEVNNLIRIIEKEMIH